jgi:hypothetical protein
MPGLGNLRLAQFLGLAVEGFQSFAAAAEGLQDTDAVDGLFNRGGEVAGLVLAAPGNLAEAGPEPETVDHHGSCCGQEDQGQLPAHGEHDDDADHHRQGGHHQHDGPECHPAPDEVEVRHGAGKQLARAPAVMEGDGEVLQVTVERDPHPGLHGGGRVDHEGAAQGNQHGFGDAQGQDEAGRAPHGVRGGTGAEGIVDEHAQHLRDGEGNHAGQERREQAHKQARQDRLHVRIETADGSKK